MKPESEFMQSRPSGCICEGGQTSKYFKNEKERTVIKVTGYCPMCHPNLANPIFATSPDQEEIRRKDFEKLSSSEGWQTENKVAQGA